MWNSARQLPGASYDPHMALRIELCAIYVYSTMCSVRVWGT